MEQKNTNWLQIKVFIGLGLLLLGTVSVVAYLNLLNNQNNANQNLLSYVQQLHVQGKAIQRRATNYAKNAPRDFAPYGRDLIIFYPEFMNDLSAFDQQIFRIAITQRELPQHFLLTTNDALKNDIQQLQSSWIRFQQGFEDKLGSDPDAPRLEWGAEYVEENQALINKISDQLIMSIESKLQDQLKANQQLSYIAMLSAAGMLLLGIIWFYISIIRRITNTIKGCQRVTRGDFGYQLKIKGNDELSNLAKAFNTLSDRTQFVLNMLTKMHRQGNAESKVDSLWEEAGNYLPIQWMGLWQVHSEKNRLELMSIHSNRPMRNLVKQTIINAACNDQHLLSLSAQATPVKYDDLSQSATQIPNAKLMREILKLGLLKSQLIIPLKSDNGWRGILILVAAEKAAYSHDQLELMGNLASYMANGFSQKSKSYAESDSLKSA